VTFWQKIFAASSVKKETALLPEEVQVERREPAGELSKRKDFSVAHLNIKDGFAEDVAVLHVQMDGKDKYRLVGTNRLETLDVRDEDLPPRSLGELTKDGVSEDELRRSFIDYSGTRTDLRRWLLKLLATYGDKLKLIIIDHTHYEIPWELIDLNERDYVGAKISTSRWLDVFTPTAEEYFLAIVDDECVGRTLSCYLYAEVDHKKIEASAVSRLESEQTSDFLVFFESLRKQVDDIGMVIVSSHAFFESGKSRQISVGSKDDPKQRLPLSTFRETKLEAIAQSRPIVFFNGCNSARLTSETERFRNSYRLGFPEVFLAKGARGFIGTLAGVHDLHAAEFARDFIDKTLQKPDTPIAAIVKELRAEAAAALPYPAPDDMESRKFLNTFMYVYYGSPLTNLRLKEA
jgi:hypothetical protein